MAVLAISYFIFILYVYINKIGSITPLSIFIGLSIFYVMSVPVIYFTDSDIFHLVAERYANFDSVDLWIGMLLFIVYSLFLIYIDNSLINKLRRMESAEAKLHGSKVEIKGVNYIFLATMACSIIGYISGVLIYGHEMYFHGYDSQIGTNYNSIGNAIITMSDVIFFLSCAVLAKHTKYKINTIYIIIFLYAIPHFIGGGRLMFLIGMIMFIFMRNDFIIKLNKKILLAGLALFILLAFVGALRSEGGKFYYGILEFAFVGFGYYNVISYRDMVNAEPLKLILDVVVFSLPAVFDKSDYISKLTIIEGLGVSQRDLSPVGGNFYLADLYLYLGVFGFLVALIIPTAFRLLILKYTSSKDVIKRLFLGIFVMLFIGFVSMNLIRNGILPASSALIKSIFIYILIVILSGKFERVFMKNTKSLRLP